MAVRSAHTSAHAAPTGSSFPRAWSAGFMAAGIAAAGLFAFSPLNRPANADISEGVGDVDVLKGPGLDLLKKVDALEAALAKRTNAAFVFIKPHAVNDAVASMVKNTFAEQGIEITGEGVLDYKTIDEQMLIDNHYGAIANKAMTAKPADLGVTEKAKAAFKEMSGMTWEEANKKGLVYNAAGACEKWGVDGKQLDERWAKGISNKKNLVKFGGGFYVGKVEDIFIVNGFYMAMRGKFTEAPAKIHYFTVEWDAATLSWEDFRGKVLGATDPSTAAEGSVRREILNNWQKLGLASKPFTGDNGVHASASPFEAMAERANWLGHKLETDIYGKAMLASGIPRSTITAWIQDPQVSLVDGSKGSLFDALEDTNAIVCLEKAKQLKSLN